MVLFRTVEEQLEQQQIPFQSQSAIKSLLHNTTLVISDAPLNDSFKVNTIQNYTFEVNRSNTTQTLEVQELSSLQKVKKKIFSSISVSRFQTVSKNTTP